MDRNTRQNTKKTAQRVELWEIKLSFYSSRYGLRAWIWRLRLIPLTFRLSFRRLGIPENIGNLIRELYNQIRLAGFRRKATFPISSCLTVALGVFVRCLDLDYDHAGQTFAKPDGFLWSVMSATHPPNQLQSTCDQHRFKHWRTGCSRLTSSAVGVFDWFFILPVLIYCPITVVLSQHTWDCTVGADLRPANIGLYT